MSLYDSIDNASYNLLEVFRLGQFFDNHKIPPVVFPILLAVLIAFLAFTFMHPGGGSAATNITAGTGNSTPGTNNCGDGICEPSELQSGACPDDCGQGTGNELPGLEYCGDGACDGIELESGMCPQDCGPRNESGTRQCGDGTCDDAELQTGLCPQDCG